MTMPAPDAAPRDPLFGDITIHVHDALGVASSITVKADRYYDALRALGARGMWSGDLPPGGLRLPLASEVDFDWRLVGGRIYTDRDGDIALWARGYSWKRRDLPANEKKGMPAIVKYSRGARPTDDPIVIEGDEGTSFRYVTFATFSGGGIRNEAYALPRTPERGARPAARAAAPEDEEDESEGERQAKRMYGGSRAGL